MALGWSWLGEPLQITELVRALLNAELPEVLVVSGLAFLAIAIYADISGRIDPSRQGRLIGGVIGSILIITGLWMHVAVPTNGPNGDGPQPTPVQTPTQTPVPETPSINTVEFPRGFNELGYTDREAAADTIFKALASRSFTSTTRVDGDPTIEIVVTANPETRRVHKIDRRDGSVAAEAFFDSGTTQTRTTGDIVGFKEDVTTYDRAVHFDGQFDEIAFGATLSNPRVSRDQGRTMITYDVAVDEGRGHLTITEDGFIVEYTVDSEVDGETRTIRYVTSKVGETTVEMPRWVEE